MQIWAKFSWKRLIWNQVTAQSTLILHIFELNFKFQEQNIEVKNWIKFPQFNNSLLFVGMLNGFDLFFSTCSKNMPSSFSHMFRIESIFSLHRLPYISFNHVTSFISWHIQGCHNRQLKCRNRQLLCYDQFLVTVRWIAQQSSQLYFGWWFAVAWSSSQSFKLQ